MTPIMRNLKKMSRPFSVAVSGSLNNYVICPKYMRKKGKVMPAKMDARVPTTMKYFYFLSLNLKMERKPTFSSLGSSSSS